MATELNLVRKTHLHFFRVRTQHDTRELHSHGFNDLGPIGNNSAPIHRVQGCRDTVPQRPVATLTRLGTPFFKSTSERKRPDACVTATDASMPGWPPIFRYSLPFYQGFTHPLLLATSFFTPDLQDPNLSPSVVFVTCDTLGPLSDPEALTRPINSLHAPNYRIYSLDSLPNP